MANFTVYAKMNITVSVEISAKHLDEALEKSKKLNQIDFITFVGDYMDGDFKINGVIEND